MKKFNLIPVFFTMVLSIFFFGSCEKINLEETTGGIDAQNTAGVNQQPEEGATNIMLPDDIVAEGQAAATAYFEKLSDEQRANAINAFTIMDYLVKKGKINAFIKDHGTVSSYEGIDWSAYLSNSEIHELYSSLVTAAETQDNSRGSWHCYAVYRLVCGIWQYQYTVCRWY